MDRLVMKQAKERRQKLIENQTTAERRFASILKGLRIYAVPQAVFFLDHEHYRIVDFYIPKPQRVCIELDGSAHDNQRTKDYDDWKDAKLSKSHPLSRVVRFTNDQVFSVGIQNLVMDAMNSALTFPKAKFKRYKSGYKKNWFRKQKSGYNNPLVVASRNIEISQRRNPGMDFERGFTLRELRASGIL